MEKNSKKKKIDQAAEKVDGNETRKHSLHPHREREKKTQNDEMKQFERF